MSEPLELHEALTLVMSRGNLTIVFEVHTSLWHCDSGEDHSNRASFLKSDILSSFSISQPENLSWSETIKVDESIKKYIIEKHIDSLLSLGDPSHIRGTIILTDVPFTMRLKVVVSLNANFQETTIKTLIL